MFNFNQLASRYDELIWQTDTSPLPRWQRGLVAAARILHPVIADLINGMPALRAMSLVYTTLLSLVPLLAVSFSVLKGFGVHNQIEPMLLNMLSPLGDKAAEITQRIIGFVENMKAGVLGSVGLAMLIYTIISLTQKIERAFNEIWHVREERPLSQRFANYLSVILVGPVLVFSALGVIATMMSSAVVRELASYQPLGTMIELFSKLIPYLLIIAAFSFVYSFVPNTKVRVRSALLGGIVSSLLWNSTGWLFAAFIADANNYTAVYSAFASLILFMIWLYLNWLILLIGSSIAFYHQHPEYQRLQGEEPPLSNHQREQLTLEVMAEIADRFLHGRPPIDSATLSRELGVPRYAIDEIVTQLLKASLLTHTAEEPPGLVLLKPPGDIPLHELILLIRAHNTGHHLYASNHQPRSAVAKVIARQQQAITSALSQSSVSDLVRDSH